MVDLSGDGRGGPHGEPGGRGHGGRGRAGGAGSGPGGSDQPYEWTQYVRGEQAAQDDIGRTRHQRGPGRKGDGFDVSVRPGHSNRRRSDVCNVFCNQIKLAFFVAIVGVVLTVLGVGTEFWVELAAPKSFYNNQVEHRNCDLHTWWLVPSHSLMDLLSLADVSDGSLRPVERMHQDALGVRYRPREGELRTGRTAWR